MKIGFLIAGFIFLSNPNIGIVDFIPDFIGCFLIIHGIGIAKLFAPHLKNAFRYAAVLSAVNLLKACCIPLLFKDIPSLSIVLSFTLALIECVLLVLLTGNLFEGLFYIGIRYDIPSIFTSGKLKAIGKGRAEKGVKIKRFAFAFFIFRSLLSIIPDLSDLQMSNGSDVGLQYSDLDLLVNLTVIVIGTVGAIYFLCQVIPYFRAISKDQAKASFDECCTSVYNSTGFTNKIRMRRIIVLFVIAAVLSLFISVDGVIIPAFIPAIFLMTVAVLFGFFNKKVYFSFIPSIICSVASIFDVSSRYEYYVEMHNDPEASLWSPASAVVYDRIIIFNCVERIFILVSLITVSFILYKKLKKDIAFFSNYQETDMFENEKYSALFKRFLLLIFIGIPMYVLTAFEPLIVLEIEFISVLLSAANAVWVVLFTLCMFDTLKSFYRLEAV